MITIFQATGISLILLIIFVFMITIVNPDHYRTLFNISIIGFFISLIAYCTLNVVWIKRIEGWQNQSIHIIKGENK